MKKRTNLSNDIKDNLTEFDKGYYKGLAMGVLVLIKQDQIKKPSEQITNYELLGIKDSTELELIEELVVNCRYNQEEAIKLLSDFLSGKKVEVAKRVLSKLVQAEHYSEDYEELPDHFKNIISEEEFELQLKGDSSILSDLGTVHK
jgi:hypothetical protein